MSIQFLTTGRIKDTTCLHRVRFISISFESKFIVLIAVPGTTLTVNISHGKHLDTLYRFTLLKSTAMQHFQTWCLAFVSAATIWLCYKHPDFQRCRVLAGPTECGQQNVDLRDQDIKIPQIKAFNLSFKLS